MSLASNSQTASYFTKEQTQGLESKIHSGCVAMGLLISSETQNKLIQYLGLFAKWNRAYNLSAVRDPDEMLSKHILDSLSILPHIQGSRIVDVGTGGGLPGIPLALALPEKSFALLDAKGKKTRFLHQVKQELALKNVEIVQSRVEQYLPEKRFDIAVCRAFDSMRGIAGCSSHLISREGKIFAMKGLIPIDELSELQKHYIVDVEKLVVPEVVGDRHLIILAQR